MNGLIRAVPRGAAQAGWGCYDVRVGDGWHPQNGVGGLAVWDMLWRRRREVGPLLTSAVQGGFELSDGVVRCWEWLGEG